MIFIENIIDQKFKDEVISNSLFVSCDRDGSYCSKKLTNFENFAEMKRFQRFRSTLCAIYENKGFL